MIDKGGWEGQQCLIIGGGPSLAGFNWELLRSYSNIIVINAAYIHVPWASIFFTEDIRFIERFSEREDWKAFQGEKLFHALDHSYVEKAKKCDPSISVIERKRTDKFWSRSFEDGLSYSSNSAIGALNIADLLGAHEIYLLGIDCRKRGIDANFHDYYPQDWKMPSGQCESFKSDFTYWAAPHLSHRHVVSVVNPEYVTALTCWPTVPYGEFFDHLSGDRE